MKINHECKPQEPFQANSHPVLTTWLLLMLPETLFPGPAEQEPVMPTMAQEIKAEFHSFCTKVKQQPTEEQVSFFVSFKFDHTSCIRDAEGNLLPPQ